MSKDVHARRYVTGDNDGRVIVPDLTTVDYTVLSYRVCGDFSRHWIATCL